MPDLKHVELAMWLTWYDIDETNTAEESIRCLIKNMRKVQKVSDADVESELKKCRT